MKSWKVELKDYLSKLEKILGEIDSAVDQINNLKERAKDQEIYHVRDICKDLEMGLKRIERDTREQIERVRKII